MNDKPKLEGWIEKSKEEVGYFKCPRCGALKWAVSRSSKDMVKCNKCEDEYPFDELKTVIVVEDSVICPCGEEVEIADHNKTWQGDYMCPKCYNIVAIEYKNSIAKPETVLSPKWIKSELNNAKLVCDSLYAINCCSSRIYKVLRVIHNYIIKVEKHNFRSFDPDTQKNIIFFDKENMEYIGCIVWSEGNKYDVNVLRQIFVLNDKRNQGYGTKMMKFWVKKYGLNGYNSFKVEQPNEGTFRILVKLGHIVREEGKPKLVNVDFIGGG